VYPIQVGAPISNCKGPDPMTDEVVGTISVSETWSEDASIGLHLGGVLDVGVKGDWSHATTITSSQAITVIIPPGFQGAVVA